jgi:hypothetical protein
MGLSLRGYGIHGTNLPRSIGKAASHGCIRMAQADLEELYTLVSIGDTVELIGQRNEQTAALFNPTPAVAQPQPAVLATSVPVPEPATAPAKADTSAPAAVAVPASR